jgi:hypothetical protein
VEARETRDKIEIELDARHLVTHVRAVTPQSQRITLAEHRPPRGEGVKRGDPHPGWGDAEAGKRLYESAITAAEAVGDDRLQAKATLFYAVEELRTRSESAINITAKAINLASAFQEADFDVLRSRLDDAIRECNNSATA